MSQLRTFTPAEVAVHNTAESCWLVIDGRVYDVTKFLASHPGGEKGMVLFSGLTDATDAFLSNHGGKEGMQTILAGSTGQRLLIGQVDRVAYAKQQRNAFPGSGGETCSSSAAAAAVALCLPEPHSWSNGGTRHILPQERAKASVCVLSLAAVLAGGEEAAARRRFIVAPLRRICLEGKHHLSRQQLISAHFRDFITIHKPFAEDSFIPSRQDVVWMTGIATNTGSLMPHYGLFLPTLMSQGSIEQQMTWVPKALKFEIVGSYAQTELGHGSNVRGLQTTAWYDKQSKQFVLNTPTLQATKWWISGLGCAATHVTLYAQLLLDSADQDQEERQSLPTQSSSKGSLTEFGVHVFFVQVRDEHHKPLPGIQMGDVGPKLGDNAIDTGYLRLQNVRIPREHMLSQRQSINDAGSYVRHGKSKKKEGEDAEGTGGGAASKMHYVTMMQARAGMISLCGSKLAIATTIAVRYSCVRQQGFIDPSPSISFQSPEASVLDYQMQQYRLFKQLSTAYAIEFTGQWMQAQFDAVLGKSKDNAQTPLSGASSPDKKAEISVAALQELHATSAGLKGLMTKWAADGLEDCRKSCGGHGYLLGSGVAAVVADYVWQVSAEGDFIVLLLQTARFLMKVRNASLANGKSNMQIEDTDSLFSNMSFGDLSSRRPPAAKTVEAMCDPSHLNALFAYRALLTIDQAGLALARKQNEKGTTAQQAWLACSVQMIACAQAHCTYFVVNKFVTTVLALEKTEASSSTPAAQSGFRPTSSVLKRLCSLFALTSILDGSAVGGGGGWEGILDASQMQLLHEGVTKLLDAIRPDAVTCVDAFQLPDMVLGSSIGRYDGNVYEALMADAERSALNQQENLPFQGYHEHLKPHLDIEFLKLRNGNALPSNL